MYFEFGEFVLDTDARELRQGPTAVRLSPKAFHLLEVLIGARPRAIGKQDLMEEVWPATFVVEANLSNLIGELRTALGDTARAPRYLRTVHRFGYAFACAPATAPGRSGTARLWRARWGTELADLQEGTHTIGRGDHTIRIDSGSVSRVHARLVVAAGRLTYEDLGSKNGSHRDGQRITGVVEVRRGDVMTVGTVPVTFVPVRSESTESLVRPAHRSHAR